MLKRQIQTQEQLTAYNRKTTHDIFFMTTEWLEKYIEVAGYYSDWNSRKQIQNNNVKRPDIVGNPRKAEKDFATQLLLFESMLRRNPLFRSELKEEFYRWLDATKIDKNCPERLKHVLFEFNEVLEGRGEKIRKDIENREDELDPNSPEYMKQMSEVFINIQAPMQKEKEIKKSMGGKNWNEVNIGSKFDKGVSGEGEKIFKQISKEVADKNDDFNFFPQKDQQNLNPNYNPLIDDPSEKYKTSQSSDRLKGVELAASYDDRTLEFKYQEAQAKLKREVNWDSIDTEEGLKQWLTELRVEKIKRNIKDWKIEEVITFNGHRYDWERNEWIRYDNEKKELAVIQKSAEREYNEQGGLVIDPEKIFLKDSFSEYQWLIIRHKIAQRKANHPNELESWENYDETLRLVGQLENEIRIQHSNQSTETQTTQPLKNNQGGWRKYGGSGLFGSLSLLSLLFFLV